MLSLRWLAIGAGIASFSAGAAIAASQSGETTAVTADFQAAVVSQMERQCDANHTKFRVLFEGTQTSADARLSGKLTVRAVSVVNTQNGFGYVRAKVRVSDAATGKPKLHGHAVGVIEPDGGSEGLLSGRTVGPNSMRLLANFNVQQNAQTGALRASSARTRRPALRRIRPSSPTRARAAVGSMRAASARARASARATATRKVTLNRAAPAPAGGRRGAASRRPARPS